MKIYFSCTTGNLINYKENYLTILNSIKNGGHSITRDWLPNYIEKTKKQIKHRQRSDLYTKVMLAITQADAVIFDCTVRSMGIGHQLTYALDKSKPSLLLYQTQSGKPDDLFISGSKSTFLTIKSYEKIEEIPEIVNSFLQKNLSRSKVRFQLVLDKEQNDFVEWASYKYKRNKSDIIKSAIDKLAKEDISYTKEDA